MAITGFKEIVDKKGYKVESKDRKIFEKEIGKSYFGMGISDMIEFIIYDSNDNQLPQGETEKMVRYIPLDSENIRKYFLLTQNPSNMKMNGADEYIIDIEKLITEAGYSNGIFKTQINLLNRRVGSEDISKDKLWIHEISPSRTEIRVLPLEDKNEKVYEDLQKRLDVILNEKNFRDDTIYFIQEMVESIKLEEVIKSFVTLNGNVVSGENYIKLIQKEFKINDFENFIRQIKEKLIEGTQHFISNKEFRISSNNYGRPLSTPVNIELGVDKIIEIVNTILIEVIDFYLPKQTIQNENILTIDEQITIDETKELLKTITANSKYDTDNLVNKQAVVRGCTDKSAMNYNPLAIEDDGSCIYLAPPRLDVEPIEPIKSPKPLPVEIIDNPKLKENPTITKTWYGWVDVSSVEYLDKYATKVRTKIYENAGQELSYIDGSLTYEGDIRETPKQNTYLPVIGGGSGGSGGGFVERDFGSGLGRERVVDDGSERRENIK